MRCASHCLAAIALIALVIGCRGEPKSELKEWPVEDRDTQLTICNRFSVGNKMFDIKVATTEFRENVDGRRAAYTKGWDNIPYGSCWSFARFVNYYSLTAYDGEQRVGTGERFFYIVSPNFDREWTGFREAEKAYAGACVKVTRHDFGEIAFDTHDRLELNNGNVQYRPRCPEETLQKNVFQHPECYQITVTAENSTARWEGYVPPADSPESEAPQENAYQKDQREYQDAKEAYAAAEVELAEVKEAEAKCTALSELTAQINAVDIDLVDPDEILRFEVCNGDARVLADEVRQAKASLAQKLGDAADVLEYLLGLAVGGLQDLAPAIERPFTDAFQELRMADYYEAAAYQHGRDGSGFFQKIGAFYAGRVAEAAGLFQRAEFLLAAVAWAETFAFFRKDFRPEEGSIRKLEWASNVQSVGMTIKNTNAAGFDEYDSNGFHKGLLVPAAFQMAWVDFRARSETGALALRDAINLWRRLGVPHAFEEGRKELFDAYIWLIDETNVIRNRVDQGKQLLIDMQVSNASDAFAKAAKELAEFNINLEAARPHGAARSAAQKAKSNSEMIEVDLPIEE